MNSYRSKYFTDKTLAENVAKVKKQSLYLLGKSKDGIDTFFVGRYKDAMKAKNNYIS